MVSLLQGIITVVMVSLLMRNNVMHFPCSTDLYADLRCSAVDAGFDRTTLVYLA